MITREFAPGIRSFEATACALDGESPTLPERRRDLDNGSDMTRLRSALDSYYDFVWRTVRHFGVPDADAEDAAQQVFCVFARRVEQIARGAEMAFLFSTATRVASDARRTARRRPPSGGTDPDALVAVASGADELLDERRAHQALRAALDAMPEDLRTVFVLFELEELPTAEIAQLTGVPKGTVASRLRRARETFERIVRRSQALRAHRSPGDDR